MTAAESGDYLNRARQVLQEARVIASINLPEAAGRAAYMAAYHAAQALIFDRTGKIAKTHTGVRSEFARLAKDDPRINRVFTAFHAQAYYLKAIAACAVVTDKTIRRRRGRPATSLASANLTPRMPSSNGLSHQDGAAAPLGIAPKTRSILQIEEGAAVFSRVRLLALTLQKCFT
ncbi:MAG: HEPN domain-containing protein [Beijerinckiaceae bacterium]|nr:HEPN domain-containing protein [Beijerinckiaceae bacterium]MCI0736525.1 HEPN domain-containing protein [Beijerinckiaceae bacterium]